MSAELKASVRLYALIGESVHTLPPRFVTKLEGILQAHESSRYAYRPVVAVPPPRRRSPSDGFNPDPRAAADAWRCDLRLVDRQLRALAEVLEIVHITHREVHTSAEEGIPSESLIDALLGDGRDRVRTARDALRGVL
ncbi:hypothetical protein SN15_03080 [Stenotrophomonas maltophilia]|nr:hypothetical protein SN15_03080 [Stenotrophomonas maltophilia]